MEEILSLSSKQLKEELGKSEEKYQQLKEKRDELNRIAKMLREERNLLNQEKKKHVQTNAGAVQRTEERNCWKR